MARLMMARCARGNGSGWRRGKSMAGSLGSGLAAKLVASGALALIIGILGHGDVSAPGAEKPLSVGLAHHRLEAVAFNAVRTSDDCGHRGRFGEWNLPFLLNGFNGAKALRWRGHPMAGARRDRG